MPGLTIRYHPDSSLGKAPETTWYSWLTTHQISFKKEYLVCLHESNLKLKCYITRVDFESLISKTFQHFIFYNSSSKIIIFSIVPSISLGVLHLLFHLTLETTLSQAATLISLITLEHKEVTHLGPVYTDVSGQNSDLCPELLPVYYKQQGKVCNPSSPTC